MAPERPVAVVSLEIPDTKSLMPGNFEHEHLLHPATLDGCVHGLIAATASTRKGFNHLAIVSRQRCCLLRLRLVSEFKCHLISSRLLRYGTRPSPQTFLEALESSYAASWKRNTLDFAV
jgi:hypothetical protein